MIDSNTELFELRSDEAMSLKIAERFFTEVENSLLREPSGTFDVSEVKECLRGLKSRGNENADAASANVKLEREFDKWREHLEARDLDLEAFEILRFCDSFRESLDATVFLALARFYKSLTLSTANQCKFDLMITRAFEGERVGQSRFARFDRDNLERLLDEAYDSWPESASARKAEPEQLYTATARIDKFIIEAKEIEKFDDLVGSNIFERIREFKRSLGSVYFAPPVVAAAIECNFVVGNTFSYLLGRMNSNLHIRLSSQIDLAGVLIDGSESGRVELADIFSEMTGNGADSFAFESNSDLAVLQMFLRHTAELRDGDVDGQTYETGEAMTDGSDEVPLVKTRLAALLETLTQEHPDVQLLRDHMRRSEHLDTLDLNDFLFTESAEPDVLGRRALAAILCLEEFKENDLVGGRQLSQALSNEMLAMLHFAERVGDDLADELQSADLEIRSRVLVVTNKLLNSRLQVERAVVRFAAPPEEIEEVLDTKEGEDLAAALESIGISKASVLESNRWLMAATFITILVGGSMLLFSGSTSRGPTLAENVQEVGTILLPHSERLEQAIRKDDTLFVTAKSTWEGLDDADKRDRSAENAHA